MSSTASKNYHFVFVTIWYPSDENPSEGIFIKRHALSLLPYGNVSVIALKSKKEACNLFESKIGLNEGLLECRMFYRRSSFPLVSMAVNSYRFFKAALYALKVAEKQFGEASVFFFHRLNITAPFAAFISYFLRKPFVVMEHFSGFALEAKHEKSLENAFYKLLAKRACRLIVVSEFLKQKMIEKGVTGKYEVVPNVVEIPEKVESKPKKETDKKTILHVGAFRKNKNVSLLLDAVAILLRKRNDFKVIIVGEGEEKEKVLQQTASLGIQSTVSLLGRVRPEDLQELYRMSDVLVVTSKVETFSVVAAEALANGVPVITTPCGGPQEFVNEKTGIVLKTFSPEELADALDRVLSRQIAFNPEEMRDYASKRFSSEEVGKRLFEIATHCLNKVSNSL